MAVLVVGSLNMDLVTDVKRIPNGGETINGERFNQFCGGKGANQAIAISRLEGKVAMIGKVGNDSYGETLLNTIKQNKVESYIQVEENISTGIASIIVEEDGENRIIIIHGANYKVENQDLYKYEKIIDNSSIIITQLELKMEVVETLANMAKNKNKTFILNPAPYAFLNDEILRCVTYLTPNETELALISNKTNFNSLDEVKVACHSLLKKGVKNVIVTLGKKGALIVNDTMEELIPGYKVNVVDTTGAGDCFNGALARCLDLNIPLNEAVRFANMAAALSVTKKGAIPSLPYLDDVIDFSKCIIK